jgi:predicted PurR-regulated permease PerM
MPNSDSAQQPLQRHPVKIGLALLLIAASIVALAYVRGLLLLGVLGILLAVVLSFPIDFLSRFMPRAVATLIVPSVTSQLSQMVDSLPAAIERLRDWLHWARNQLPISNGEPADATADQKWITDGVHSALSKAVPAIFGVISGFTFAVLAFALAFFLAHEPDTYHRGLRLLVPRSLESMVDEGWNRIGGALRAWMKGIIVSMTIMGVLTTVGLWAVGIKGWLVLGLLTFLGTFIPYAGAVASAIPGLLLGLAQSPKHFLLALAIYLGVHVVEGYIVQPIVMRHAVEIRPAILLIWQVLFGGIFGLLGVIVATPVLACVQSAVEYFWVERRLGKAA